MYKMLRKFFTFEGKFEFPVRYVMIKNNLNFYREKNI